LTRSLFGETNLTDRTAMTSPNETVAPAARFAPSIVTVSALPSRDDDGVSDVAATGTTRRTRPPPPR
jgi:hypothetical protein